MGIEQTSDDANNVWGLLRRKGMDQEYSLVYHTSESGERDTYRLGRAAGNDIIVTNKRVSSQHCLIYCDYAEARLRIFVQDNSANGTFVNSSLTRLAKGERTELSSGDEIFLTNPRLSGPEDEVVSFIFINMRERQILRKKVDMAPPLPRSHSINASVTRRHIEDFYIIGNQIGNGTCGKVHVCLHRSTREQYAVKVIDTRKFARSPGLSPEELRQEADMMCTLDHPNIIRIKDTFETDRVIFIVMELVTGGDLFDRIVERGKYSEQNAQLVMRQLLAAVQYLHQRNIVHRDLKPENILLVDSKDDIQVKITDFGLAKRTNQEGLKTFCGTPQYFAPEVLRRQGSIMKTGRYNFKVDTWSLGVVLFIMLSGQFPFDADNLYDQVLQGQYSLSGSEWAYVSDAAKEFVRYMMHLDAESRYSVDEALQHRWITSDISQLTSTPTNAVAVAVTAAPADSKCVPPNVQQKKTAFSPVFWSMRCGSGSSKMGTGGLPWEGWMPSTVATTNKNTPTSQCNTDDILQYSSDEETAKSAPKLHAKKARLSYTSNKKETPKQSKLQKKKPDIELQTPEPLQFSSAPLVTSAPATPVNKLLRQPISTLPELFNKYRQQKDVETKI